MGWSRDIGVVAGKDVEAKVAEATARARGVLSDADREQLSVLKNAVARGIGLAPGALAELRALEAVKDPTMSPEELATIDIAAKMAAAAVGFAGGVAHVVLGASDRKEEQPEASLKGRRQRSYTITVTVTDGVATSSSTQPSPAKVIDNALPFAGK
jgi:hypothetical protein